MQGLSRAFHANFGNLHETLGFDRFLLGAIPITETEAQGFPAPLPLPQFIYIQPHPVVKQLDGFIQGLVSGEIGADGIPDNV